MCACEGHIERKKNVMCKFFENHVSIYNTLMMHLISSITYSNKVKLIKIIISNIICDKVEYLNDHNNIQQNLNKNLFI